MAGRAASLASVTLASNSPEALDDTTIIEGKDLHIWLTVMTHTDGNRI